MKVLVLTGPESSGKSWLADAMRLYDSYLARGPLTPLPLPAFIADKLKNVGSHTLPR